MSKHPLSKNKKERSNTFTVVVPYGAPSNNLFDRLFKNTYTAISDIPNGFWVKCDNLPVKRVSSDNCYYVKDFKQAIFDQFKLNIRHRIKMDKNKRFSFDEKFGKKAIKMKQKLARVMVGTEDHDFVFSDREQSIEILAKSTQERRASLCLFVPIVAGRVIRPLNDSFEVIDHPYLVVPLPYLSLESSVKILSSKYAHIAEMIENNPEMRMLISDTGGHPRALELLYGALKESNRDIPSYFDDVQKKVSRDLHHRYRPNEFHLAPLIATTLLDISIEEWRVWSDLLFDEDYWWKNWKLFNTNYVLLRLSLYKCLGYDTDLLRYLFKGAKTSVPKDWDIEVKLPQVEEYSKGQQEDFSSPSYRVTQKGFENPQVITNEIIDEEYKRALETFEKNMQATKLVFMIMRCYEGNFDEEKPPENCFVISKSEHEAYYGKGKVETILVFNRSTMITSGGDDMVIVWDLICGSILRRIWLQATNTFPKSIQLSDNNLFVCRSDGIVRIVDMISGRVDQTVDVKAAAYAIIVNGDNFYVGKLGIVSQLEKYSIFTETLQLSYMGHTNSVNAVILWERMLFSGSADSKIICWNEANGQKIRVYEGHTAAVHIISIFENYLYSAGLQDSILKWNIDSGMIENVFPSFHSNRIWCFAFEKGSLYSGSIDATVIKWDVNTSSKLFTYSGSSDSAIRRRCLINFTDLNIYYGHSRSVVALALDEKFMYSGSSDCTMKRWNITTGSFDKEYIGHAGSVRTIQTKENDKEKAKLIDLYGYPTSIIALYIYNDVIVLGSESMRIVSLSTGEELARQTETLICIAIVATASRRDLISLSVLDTFQGHQDAVMSLCLDDSNVLFSSSLDGSVKKWNILSRKVSFSYENRNGSVTALAAASGTLFVGTRQGLTNLFGINNGYLIKSVSSHMSTVTSIAHFDGVLYSTGLDGMVYGFNSFVSSSSVVIFDAGIAASDDIVFAGSRAGLIFAYSATSFQNLFALEDNTSQVNSLLVAGSILYSASNDKSIIKWSLEQRRAIFVFKRYSATALDIWVP
ncbi:hypothetical protein MP638_002601 [Amoeboaphelidium occidentale]|nr:hypothetical protein MP638_002601 [Amoeboaphelidium occidentale]